MKQQSKDIYMTLLTGFGAAIGILIYFICTYLIKNYETFAALSIFGLAIIFRFIGYLIDKSLAKRNG